jgi:hypothetical protein
MEENRRLKGPECKNGIKCRGLIQQLEDKIGIKGLGDRRPQYVRKNWLTSMIYRMAFGLEFVKRGNGMYSEFREIRKWTL